MEHSKVVTMKTWILWLLLATSVLAQSRAEIRRALPREYSLQSYKASGDYVLATVGYTNGDGEGMVLLRKVEGRWRELGGGGGAMSSGELHLFGVPRRHWQALVGSPAPPEDMAAQGWPETAERKLTTDDLSYRSAWELTLMRNEIFARHGREFKDALLREYFASRPWYYPNPRFSEAALTPLEKQNVTIIQSYQQKSGKNF